MDVPGQNPNARITFNGIDLGTPHIFGEDVFGIYFPLTGEQAAKVSFKVEEEVRDEEQGCAVWVERAYSVEQPEGKLHLQKKEDDPWITNPNTVRVTVLFEGGGKVIYDPIFKKPEQN